MYKKGFISGYYIYNAIIVFTLIALIFTNHSQYQITRYNIQQVDQYLGTENYVIRTIQKYIEEEVDLEMLEFQQISYSLKKADHQLYIDVYQPVQETIIVYIKNDMVYDYDVIRNESSFRE